MTRLELTLTRLFAVADGIVKVMRYCYRILKIII